MRDFEKDYRKWSKVALISIVMFLFTVATIDAFLGFDFSKNMYVMSIVATGCVLALLSLTWIRILNSKLMRSDFWGKDGNQGKDNQTMSSKSITMVDVEMCIRKEGYIPQNNGKTTLFKISGEAFQAYCREDKFTLIKKYGLGEDVDHNLLLKACSQAHDEIFMFRSYLHTHDDNRMILCFEVETYIYSVAELEKFFPQYLNILLHACERHREIYHQLVNESISKKEGKALTEVRETKIVS